VLYDLREDAATRGQIEEFELSFNGTEIQFLQIPPMVAHAVVGLSSDSVVVDLASSEAQSGSDFFMADPASIPYQF
jgi:dTDP-4-dehydrorhamnose 3,5-epimerase-like enzyme